MLIEVPIRMQYPSDHVMMMPTRYEPERKPPRRTTTVVMDEVKDALDVFEKTVQDCMSCQESISDFKEVINRLLSHNIIVKL